MLKFFGEKDTTVVFSSYYGRGGTLTFELWDKNTKEQKKVRVWNNTCPIIKDTLTGFLKKLKGADIQKETYSDTADTNKKLEVFAGNGALVFRIGSMKFIEKSEANIISIVDYISQWSVASVVEDMMREIVYKLDKIMEKMGISTEKPKFGRPQLSVAREDASDIFAGLDNLINAILEEKPNGNDNDNGHTSKTETAPAVDDKQDEDIEK